MSVFFTSDLHLGHAGILKYMPNRPFAAEHDIVRHDEWLVDMWQSTIGKKDIVYILGDLCFYNSQEARRLLQNLNGRKFLVTGNHDTVLKSHANYFVKVTQIMELRLTDKLKAVACHYPLVDWNGKQNGTVMLHGHTHGTLDDYNNRSTDLRFDVGIDGCLAKQAGGIVDIDTLLSAIESKTRL